MCGFLSSYTSASAIYNTPSATFLLASLTLVSTTKTHKYNVNSKVAYKSGSFAIRSGDGTQDITDVGFTPKALILWSSGTTNETYRDSVFVAYGFTDGTTQCCTGLVTNDPVSTTVTKSNIRNDSLLMFVNNGTSYYSRATFNSFLSRGFRLNWIDNATGGQEVNYIAIAGDDITNVKVGTQSIGTTTTGNKSYTGVGFQGDFLLTAHSGFLPTGSAYTYDSTIETHAGFQLGAAKSSTERFTVTAISENGVSPSDTYRYQRGDKCFSYIDNTTGALLSEADFVSWDTDGFTFNYTTNTTANNQNAPFIYLAIKGGVWDVGYFTSPTTNTTVQTDTSTSGILKGISTVDDTSDFITSSTILTQFVINIGSSDGTNTNSISTFDFDAANPTIGVGIKSNQYLIWQFLATATAASSTHLGRCTVTFADHSFTTTWTNTDGNARYIPYFAISESSGTATLFDRPISETSVSVSEALARVQIKIKPISEPSVSVSETLARVQSLIKTINETSVSVSEALARIQLKIKPISESAISVSEALVRGLVYTRPINEPSISTNDSIVRLPLYLRPINDTPAITTNDSIARWISISYTLAEPSISINDTIAGVLFYPRTINESAISVNDSIVRLLAATRAISESSITVNDTIARIQSLIKQISESAISVNDSVQGSLLFTALLIESRIKWYYSLLTRKIV